MLLKELIDKLKELINTSEEFKLSKTVEGFGNPHSYRGYYDELAFEPMYTTMPEMLEAALSADSSCYRGYKGGEFKMRGDTKVNLAFKGYCGAPITIQLLDSIAL